MTSGPSSELQTLARARAAALVPPAQRQPWAAGLVWAGASLLLLSGYAALIGARSASATYIALATALVIGGLAFADAVAKNRRNQSEYQESLAYLKIFGAGMYEGDVLDSFGKAAAGRRLDPPAKATGSPRAPKRRKAEPQPRRKPAAVTSQPSP
jgi:hypothetical protein